VIIHEPAGLSLVAESEEETDTTIDLIKSLKMENESLRKEVLQWREKYRALRNQRKK